MGSTPSTAAVRSCLLGVTVLSVGGCGQFARHADYRLSEAGLRPPAARLAGAESTPACRAVSAAEIAGIVGASPTSVESFANHGPKENLCKFTLSPTRWFYIGVHPLYQSEPGPEWCDDRISDYPNAPRYLPHCSAIASRSWVTVESAAEDISKEQMSRLLHLALPRLTE